VNEIKHEMYLQFLIYPIALNMKIIKMNWSKELWFALLFISVGFTVWPLMVYYLGLALGIGFFESTTLRVWAEQMVYGPLGQFSLLFLRSLTFLFTPYLFFNFLRLILCKPGQEV